jgi:cytochrome P450
MDMLVGGMDTSSTTIEWVMSEALKNPPLLKKLQDELERVVGMGRMVRESDLPCLVYLQAVVKETLRLHPVVPLGFHLSVEDCTVLGYEIPRNTRLVLNLWAIGRNPKSWGEDAQSFKPGRFLIEAEAGLAHKTHENFDWLPFGAGRRGCPGQQLGTLVVEFAVAQLLHCFNWRLPLNGQELDMTEKFNGLTLPRAQELLAVPTPRLPVL